MFDLHTSVGDVTLSAIIRAVSRDCANRPIEIVSGTQVPALTGCEARYYTPGGTRVYHPSAYSKKCFRPLIREPSTIHTKVGDRWIREMQRHGIRVAGNKYCAVYIKARSAQRIGGVVVSPAWKRGSQPGFFVRPVCRNDSFGVWVPTDTPEMAVQEAKKHWRKSGL